MKKALSIILCLAMLMSTVPVSVFAVPTAVTTEDSAIEFIPEQTEKDSENAELAAEGTVMPVKVLPENGTTVDRRYPVAYYTFAKSVKIDAADVTLENIGNENVGGVYFEEETNTIWVFPANPMSTVYITNSVSYDAWTSNIAAEDGSLLSFPGVKFDLETSIPADGQNMVPFGNMEYGWTPFGLNETSGEGQFSVVVDPENPDNHVTARTWMVGQSKWPHAHVDALWTPGSSYKVKAKVMIKDLVNANGEGGNNGSTTLMPNPIYTVPSFSCVGKPVHDGQTGTVCTICGKEVDREHATSFSDHPVSDKAVAVSVTNGVSNGWQELEAEFTARENLDLTKLRVFSIYSNPASGTYATEFYIDDVEIYEEVEITFVAGRYTEVAGRGVSAKSGFYGDTIELPQTLRGRNGFNCTQDGYVIDGWTDGTNVYAVGDEYTVTGPATLTPNVIPTGDGYKVNLSVPEEFEDCYAGLGVISVAVGETVDLTADEYALEAPVGYSVLGWKNADTDEFVTSVTGAKDEVINLVAAFELRTGIVIDTEAKAAELKTGNGAGAFDEAVPGLKVTPSNKDPFVTFDNLAIITEEYSFVDVTYVSNDTLTASNGGFVYIDADTSKGVEGTKLSEESGLVTYRYDLAANEAWIDTCSSVRIDPYNDNPEFTITEIQFVKNEVVEQIDISDLTAPVISATPDMEAAVTDGAAYEVTSITWDPADEYFMGSTEYTATVEIAINKSGYMFTEDTVALLNGENTDVVVSAKAATVTKTFPATEAPKAITITLTSADAISTNDGTLALEAEIAPVNADDVILPDTYTWSITGGDVDIATLEGNVLTAKWNGTVEVTATPDYDPSQAKAFDIVITGQTGFNVTYDKNTGADVTNMPTVERAKKDYTVSSMVPVRSGYTFSGWMTSPEANAVVTDLKVTKDITLYAKWTKGGYVFEFDNEGDTADNEKYFFYLADGNRLETSGVNTIKNQVHVQEVAIDREKDEAVITLGGGNDFYMTVVAGDTAAPIDLSTVKTVEYGFRTDAKGTFGYAFYFATKDPVTGAWIAPNHADGGQAYVDNKISPTSTAVNGNEEVFYTLKVDTSVREQWTGNFAEARLDIENSADFPGKKLYIDYIKFIGAESVENFELTIDAPEASAEAYGLEAVSTTSDKFVINSITWEGPELIDGKYYADASAYTAKVEIAAADGYVLSDAPLGAFVNGEAAEIAVSGEKAVITYTFPATETLEEITLSVRVADNAPAEITTSFGTLQLEERVVAVSGADIGNYEVIWSIDPSQKKFAWVDENGLVTGNTDCEALVVTATSKYDPSVKASVTIKISGQIPESNIYFAAGTGETVTGLPEATTAKDEYVLPMDVIPERSGYIFKGWSKELGGDVIKVDNVSEDTTYYAVWGYYKSDEFGGSTVFASTNGFTGKKFEDGVMIVTPTNTKISEGIHLEQGSGIFGTGSNNRLTRVAVADFEYLEFKTNIAPENLEVSIYVQTNDTQKGTGGTVTTWNESANTRLYSNKKSYGEHPNQNIFDYCEQRGDWYVYRVPTSILKNWDNYLERLRFNFIQRDMNDLKNNTYLAYPDGFEAKFDYLRLVGRDIPVMDIAGIEAPAVKGEAVTTATVVQAEAFEITSVEWSPALLGGIYFGSGVEYTVTMTAELLDGYNSFSNPPARVTVNGNEAEYDRYNTKKAIITYTFPATEDVGELALVNVNLHETNDDGTVTETKQIFSGDDFDLDKFSATNNPTGKRWIGWSETEGGELVSGTINITEDADYYAVYEDITGYDFSNKYHKNEKNVKASGGTASFDGAWVVVTPKYDNSKAILTLDGMNISAADYDYIEVIYDGSLEDANNDNKFSEDFAPVLMVNGSTEVALIKAEPVIASNRVSYKYTYDLTVNGKPDAINSFDLVPYEGKPDWAVTSVMLVPNTAIEEAIAITGVKAPATWLMPDVSAEASENYEIESITWDSENGFNDDGSYKSETEYTATIVVTPATGYKITELAATIDGELADEVALSADGKLTIKKAFAATEALIPFELTVADAEINVADGTVTLVPEFSAEIDVKTVKWEITENGPDGKSAEIDENGVVKAYFDGVVKVKATSDYNPLVTAEATVTITNQIANYTVTFNPNTTSEVTNMPEDVEIKLDYVLPTEAPVRPGFEFAGWAKSETDTATITKDYVTGNTTYYALWVRGGLHYEFFDANENPDKQLAYSNVAYTKIDTENGVLEFQPKISSNNSLDTIVGIQNLDKTPMFKGSDYPVVVVRMKSTMSSFATHKIYFTSVDVNGKDLVPSFAESACAYTKIAVGPDGYTDIVIDMSGVSGWMDGYVKSIRFDPLDGGATLEHLNSVLSIDYIRAVSYETGIIEVTGVDTPVAKATADTTAESKDASKYVVTNVEWEGGLIYDYYFGGETEYTVCVTVKGATGYVVSDAPTKATINGKAADSTSYNAETGELTLKYTFPATGVLENDTAYTLTLYGKDDDGVNVAEERTVFAGGTFEIGTYVPANIPSGKRWIGWSEDASSTENTVDDVITINEAKSYYAVYEDLVEFDYSNYYHQFGTTVKGGVLTYEDGLAVITPANEGGDAALITPVMNIAGKDFGFVEVYYSATLTSKNDGVEYTNLFSAVLKPELKFSRVENSGEYIGSGVLVGVEKVMVGSKMFQKYTYDMSSVADWARNDIACLCLDPYNGFPNWGVGLIKLIENEELTSSADIEFAAPETWMTPDIADNVEVSENYEITDLSWTPAPEVFEADTSYTAKVTYRPVTGYKVTNACATINGEEATVVDNGNGTFTATYTFEMTDALKDVEVVITGKNEITSKGRYLQLEGETVALDGSKVPVTDVTWSVKSKGTTTELATISNTGRIYPISNGTVIVTATSVYDPTVTATHEVEISNQADLVKVTFDKNTQAEVTGMPEAVYVYGKFEPENYTIERDGFFFAGWSVDEDALEPDASFNITEETTLYAKWGAGYEWSFDNKATSLNIISGRTVTYENGIATISCYAPNPAYDVVAESSGLTSLGLETAAHTTIEMSISLPMASQIKYYLRSGDTSGNQSPWNESANTNSIDQSQKPANKDGEFQVVTYKLGGHTNWNMYPYVERIRLDVPGVEGEDAQIKIDYVRLLTTERSVKFDGNGGLIPLYGGEVTSFKETYTTGTINLPEDPTRDGYEFLGWAKKTEDYTKLYNNKFTVSDDVTLYAIWTPAAELNEETVTAESAEVTVNESNGNVTITSAEETTPVVSVADTMEVGDNQTIVVEVNADYASTTDGKTVLTFVAEDGTPVEVVLDEDGLSGKETLIVDLSEVGFEGTVTDVTLTLPTGVINSLEIRTVAFATSENAKVFDTESGNVVSINPTVIVTQGGQTTQHPGHVSYPSMGGGTVTENASSTTVSPKDKVAVVPARPDLSDDEDEGTTTPSKPSTPSKFPFTMTYDGRFVDVTRNNWFYDDVEKSFRLGLMNGKSATHFVPDGTVTLAEAITVAARMRAIYYGDTITQGTGNNWYQPYVDYATSKAIITKGQYSDYTALATREQVAALFVRALPASWYTEINLFINIPDVPTTHASYAIIQRLYNAGVITGVDSAYNFKPNDNIKRSELSAIINRVALVDSRLRVVTEDEKNNKDKKFGVADIMSTLVIGNCVEKEWVEKDGAAFAQPAKPDPVINGLQNLMGGMVDADEYKTIKVVLTSSKASEMVGQQAQLFFSADGTLSEANSIKTKITKNADGTLLAQFDGNSNQGWKGNLTTVRFDPWNKDADFSLISITFAP